MPGGKGLGRTAGQQSAEGSEAQRRSSSRGPQGAGGWCWALSSVTTREDEDGACGVQHRQWVEAELTLSAENLSILMDFPLKSKGRCPVSFLCPSLNVVGFFFVLCFF